MTKVNPATADALARAAEQLKYQNKQQQINQAEEHLRQEKLRLKRNTPSTSVDPTKGTNVDKLV
jgi:hypothetical protein